jgi:hypothetical protein
VTKLNQIIAIEKGVKAKATRELTDLHREVQQESRLSGIVRTYQPKDDDGDALPAEFTSVQIKAEAMLQAAADVLTRLFDVVATKDYANMSAVANVSVDGKVLLNTVPVTHLLFLEKQLVDVRTFVVKIPTLDPAEEWTRDSTTGIWAAKPYGTARTKKVPRNHVKALATVQHPEQVEMYYEDQIMGTWTTKKFSGALSEERVAILLARVDKLIEAVKFAREEANSGPVTDRIVGKKIFDYLLS